MEYTVGEWLLIIAIGCAGTALNIAVWIKFFFDSDD